MTDEDHKQPIVLSRDDLYSQIWTTPMSRLAAQYGITGNGLAKICARLNVPCPPRGYWAKKAAGKRVVQYRLPEPDAETLLQVTITPAPPPETHAGPNRNPEADRKSRGRTIQRLSFLHGLSGRTR